MGCTTCDLREKDVVNICTGQRLGCVCELELDTECGRVVSLIVSGTSFASSVLGKGRVCIPWDKIRRIGRDTILVDMPSLPSPGASSCESGFIRRFRRGSK